jgi:hypothetical protein
VSRVRTERELLLLPLHFGFAACVVMNMVEVVNEGNKTKHVQSKCVAVEAMVQVYKEESAKF